MEKLIELLNEYRNKELWYNVPEWEEYEIWVSEDKLISKRFGFIRWLVDNDKIELPTSCAIDKNNDYSEREIKSDYESLLMLLAIQDEPIELLISILK